MNLFDVLFAKKLSGGGSPFPPVIKRVTGNPIEFTDGADAPLVKCVTEIQGSQDLHGYDKPWVGGAGKNKLNPATTPVNAYIDSTNKIVSNSNNRTIYMECIPNTTYSYTWGRKAITGNDDSKVIAFETTPNIGDTGTFMLNLASNSGTYKGTFTTGANDHYLAIKIANIINSDYQETIDNSQIELGSTATAYTPYSNICPITAYTEGEIEVRGSKNQLPPPQNDTVNGVTLVNNSDGSFTLTGTASNNAYFDFFAGNFDSAKYAGKVIYFTTSQFYVGINIRISTASRTAIQQAEQGGRMTINNNGSGLYVSCRIAYGSTLPTGGLTVKAMIIDADDTNEFEPYEAPTTHTTTYPSAIYQGNADFVGGSARGVELLKEFDGTENWQKFDTGRKEDTPYFCLDFGVNKIYEDDSSDKHGVCSHFQNQPAISISNQLIGYRVVFSTAQGKQRVIIRPSDYTQNINDFKTWISTQKTNNMPLQISVILLAPTTEQITISNLPIKSLSGYNHIESSTGEMEIDYITDAYQNFVDTTERAIPSTRKAGLKAFDIFKTLDEPIKPEASAEESGPEEKETEEVTK